MTRYRPYLTQRVPHGRRPAPGSPILSRAQVRRWFGVGAGISLVSGLTSMWLAIVMHKSLAEAAVIAGGVTGATFRLYLAVSAFVSRLRDR